jgi:uncharacterized repeat protein (TIGR03803 family)
MQISAYFASEKIFRCAALKLQAKARFARFKLQLTRIGVLRIMRDNRFADASSVSELSSAFRPKVRVTFGFAKGFSQPPTRVHGHPNSPQLTPARRCLMGVQWVRNAICTVMLFGFAALSSSAQTFSNVVSFNESDGQFPFEAPLLQGADGNFYGTTLAGGAHGEGTVFKLTSAGELTTLYSFCSKTSSGVCTDGASPEGGLIQGTNGNFYGTTNIGGTGIPGDCGIGCGTVFEITPGGTLTTLYSFCSLTNCADGNGPQAGLVQGPNGNFYGTTYYGGANSTGIAGTVFEITPAGKLTTLYSFCSQESNGKCLDGAGVGAGLVFASSENFYGSTYSGGTGGYGTIFQISAAGKLKTLINFTGPAEPSTMIQATNGSLYGTTFEGGSESYGTIFQINTAGELSTLYNFCSRTGCEDGSNPYGPPIEGSDGNFYGTTSGGGEGFGGTVYEITTSGMLTTLYNFCAEGSSCLDGHSPESALVQETNGVFFGTTFIGGTDNDGTIFSLSIGLGDFVEARPNFGKAGQVVGILGSDLTDSSSVTFNGTAAKFKVISATLIEAEVPAGATSGSIEVDTPSGPLTSNTAFLIE